MSICTKWLIPLGTLCALVFVGALAMVLSAPKTDINRELPIPQVNLAKIYILGVEIKRDREAQPELFDEEPDDNMIRNMMVFYHNYNDCFNSDKNQYELFDCTEAITQREVDLVRLAFTDGDSFTIEVEE